MSKRARTTLVIRTDPWKYSQGRSWFRDLPDSHVDELRKLAPKKGGKLNPISRWNTETLRRDLDTALSQCQPSFKLDYLMSELWSKFCDERLVSAQERRRAAIRKWITVEEMNQRTNIRLYGQYSLMGVDFHVFVEEVRAIVARVLGSVLDVDLSSASFTNGASVGVRRDGMARIQKLYGKQHLSSSAVKWWVGAFSGTILGAGQCRESATQILGLNLPITVTESSVLFTVPKKTEIDRCACKEPAGNALLQRAVGLHIRRRLKSVNIDLQDQTRNQRMAYAGSLAGYYSTIDLSSASDTMTNSLVAILLPGDWWSLLDDIRVKSAHVSEDPASKSTLVDLEMFSSMGNGFTFELETLLFYALARATMQRMEVKGRCLVYGDDIIVPSAVTPTLLRNLRCFGFVPNPKKTHFGKSDLFRESCGKHYHKGLDVSPFYIRGPVINYPSLTNLLNQLLEWDGRGWGFFQEPSLRSFWEEYRKDIPGFLAGGVHTDDPGALVTGDNPRLRLASKSKIRRVKLVHGGSALAAWLMEKRNSDSNVGVDPTEDSGSYRVDVNPLSWGTTSWKPGELR